MGRRALRRADAIALIRSPAGPSVSTGSGTLVVVDTTQREAPSSETLEEVVPRAVVLVEGLSDRLALEALARRRGRDLEAEGVAVATMGGVMNIRAFLVRYGPQGLNVQLAGLYDAGEEADVRRGLERAGLGSDVDREGLERLGFFACDADLEDELIRALGVAAVERVLDAQGDLMPFRTFQRQPAWRGRSAEEQLRRFLGTHSGRKIQTAPLLVEALDLDRVPRPLDAVLSHV
jgi:hypothetical protein